MLAPFGPFNDAEKVTGADLAKLAAPCLLKGTDLPIQKAKKPSGAYLRPTKDDGCIREGSHVILYATRDNIDSIIIKKGAQFNNKHGHFAHDDMIGRPFGSRIYSRKPHKGWLIALRPTSELWTLGCNHRTEILYLSDISFVLMNLGIKPGSLVIETGTGTGSLSTAFITALQPTGRLYTFEYHDERAAGAASDFDRNALAPWVTVTHRDTIALGFPAELDAKINAVFLDLPAPWVVVPAAKKSLKHSGMFCSFSPCIEQIQATAEALTAHGFVNIEMVECLQKTYDVRSLPSKKDEEDWKITDSPQNLLPANYKKRARVEVEEIQEGEDKEDTVKRTLRPAKRALVAHQKKGDSSSTAADETAATVTLPFPEMRGHTGYLIFARSYNIPSKDKPPTEEASKEAQMDVSS